MKWEYIIIEVIILYLKVAAVCLAYLFAKFYVAENKSSLKPSLIEKLFHYVQCAAVVAVIALVASGINVGRKEEYFDFNRGAIVFIVLILSVFVGVADGHNTSKKYSNSSRRDDYGDM